MRVSTSEDDNFEDMDECPHCGAWLLELADEVTDEHFVEVGKDAVASVCPACKNEIAIVRTCSYSVRRLKKRT